MKITRFILGRITCTPGVLAHPEVSTSLPGLLRRHRNCDFGDVPIEDKKANLHALRTSVGRVVSSYQVQAKKLFLITEGLGHHSLGTTIMFAEEY